MSNMPRRYLHSTRYSASQISRSPVDFALHVSLHDTGPRWQSGVSLSCIGYLDHLFKNRHIETEQEMLSLELATCGIRRPELVCENTLC